jgi:hypothetical protein
MGTAMRALDSISTAVAMVLLAGATAGAQSATQVVSFRVNPISEIAISGSPAPLVVDAPRSSQQSATTTMGGTSYAITANEGNQRISAALNEPMPNGVSLAVSLDAPAGGASRGITALGTSARDVVTGIPAVAARGLPIVYTLNATSSARQGAAGTRIVTYTVTAGL